MKNLCLTLPDAQGRDDKIPPLTNLKPIRFEKAARYAWLLAAFCLLCFALMPQVGQGQAAYTLQYSDVTMSSRGGTITGYRNRTQKNIIIPASIGSVRVTSIGSGAFEHNRLTRVAIPNSVTHIGYGAFYNNQLTSVDIPNSVTNIGYGAFNHNAIAQVNGTPSNGLIYARNADGTDNRTAIASYGGTAKVIDFIPNSVTSIGEEAFAWNQLTRVAIPNSVTSIGDRAFEGNDLTTVTLAENSRLIVIGAGAFGSNSGLTSITLPASASAYVDARWKDEDGNAVSGAITNFSRSYELLYTTVKERNLALLTYEENKEKSLNQNGFVTTQRVEHFDN